MSSDLGPSHRLVVLLFTDLVGSTAQRQRLGERDAESFLHEVDQLQHDVIAAHGGALVKHLGDGVMAAFDSAEPRRSIAAPSCSPSCAASSGASPSRRRCG